MALYMNLKRMILPVILALLLPMCAVAEPHTAEAIDLTFDLPEGMQVINESGDSMEGYAIAMADLANPARVITLQIQENPALRIEASQEASTPEDVMDALSLNPADYAEAVFTIMSGAAPLSELGRAKMALVLTHSNGLEHRAIEVHDGYLFDYAIVQDTPLTEDDLAFFDAFAKPIMLAAHDAQAEDAGE